MSERSGRGQHLSSVGAFPAELLDEWPDLAEVECFGTWLIQAAVMGA